MGDSLTPNSVAMEVPQHPPQYLGNRGWKDASCFPHPGPDMLGCVLGNSGFSLTLQKGTINATASGTQHPSSEPLFHCPTKE